MRRVHAFPLALLLSCLAGCATAPLPVPPAPPREERFDDASMQSDAAAGAAEAAAAGVSTQRIVTGPALQGNWWQVFHAPRLDRLVELALQDNPSVQEASARLAQAGESVQVTQAEGGPQASLAAGAGREKYGAQFLGTLPKPPPFSYFSVGPAVSYTVDLAGGESHSVARQQSLAEVERQRLLAAQLAVSGHVVLQALAVAQADRQLATAAELLALERQWLALAEAGVEGGGLARRRLNDIRGRLAADQGRLPPLREQRDRARHALSVLLGTEPTRALPELPVLEDWQLPEEIPVGVPSELAHRRPDIQAAEAQVRAAIEAVGVARSELYPQLTLGAATGLQATDLGHLLQPASTVFGLAAGLSAPLWDGGRLEARRRAALDALDADAAWDRQVILTAFGQVADALASLAQDRDSLVAAVDRLAAAATESSDARHALQEGDGNRLQALEAECSELRQRLDWQSAQTQRLRDTATLLLALGGSGEETFRH